MWRGGWPSCQPSPLARRPPTHAEDGITPHWCDFMLSIFSMPYHTRRAHNHTPWVWFCVWHLFFTFLHLLNMKWHPHWCLFMVGCLSDAPPPAEHETHTNEGGFHIRHLFFCHPTYVKHKMTPSLVLFCVRILFSPPQMSFEGVRLTFYILGNSNYIY